MFQHFFRPVDETPSKSRCVGIQSLETLTPLFLPSARDAVATWDGGPS